MLQLLVDKLKSNPLFQAGLVLIVVMIFSGLSSFDISEDSTMNAKMQPWVLSATGLLFLAIWNTVFGLMSKSFAKYYLLSIIAYVSYVVLTALISQGISGLSIYEAKSMTWIYAIFTIGYIVLLVIVSMMRKIVQYAQSENRDTFPVKHKNRPL